MKTLSALLIFMTLAAGSARADYSTILVGVRLHLTTTTVPTKTVFSSSTVNGFIQISANREPGEVQLSTNVIEGYIWRMSRDPDLSISSSTKPSDLGRKQAIFIFDSDLVQLKYPRQVLVNTGSIQGLFIPFSIISGIERFNGRFGGDAGMGQPFYIPSWQAALMKEKPPVFSCSPPTERGEVEWISYNPNVGEKELSKVCEKENAEPQIYGPLIEKGNVFTVVYPAD